MADPFDAQVARALSALGLPASVLVAASAGADSTALVAALAFARSRREFKGLRVVVGHVRHALRPDADTARDWAAVQALAGSVGFAADVRRVEVAGPGGLEEAAREARYQALEGLAEAHGCQAVLTAHTATDQAETVLMRLARGAGARGLGGMAPSRPLGKGLLLRPLLGVTRAQTRAYCERNGLLFLDDPTNLTPRPRVRVRLEVLPVLEALAPGAALRIAQAARRLRDDDALLDALANQALQRGEPISSLPGPLRRRALAAWCQATLGTRRRVTAAHLEALERLVLDSRGEVELPATRLTRRVAIQDGEGGLRLVETPRANRSCTAGPPTARTCPRDPPEGSE